MLKKRKINIIPGVPVEEYHYNPTLILQLEYISKIFNIPITIYEDKNDICANFSTIKICTKKLTSSKDYDLSLLISDIINLQLKTNTIKLKTTPNTIFIGNNDNHNYWLDKMIKSENEISKLIMFVQSSALITNEFYIIAQNIELMRKFFENLIYGKIDKVNITLLNGTITYVDFLHNTIWYEIILINNRGNLALITPNNSIDIFFELIKGLKLSAIEKVNIIDTTKEKREFLTTHKSVLFRSDII